MLERAAEKYDRALQDLNTLERNIGYRLATMLNKTILRAAVEYYRNVRLTCDNLLFSLVHFEHKLTELPHVWPAGWTNGKKLPVFPLIRPVGGATHLPTSTPTMINPHSTIC
jgi:hypothetical protein